LEETATRLKTQIKCLLDDWLWLIDPLHRRG
jgi:hypothetical protein